MNIRLQLFSAYVGRYKLSIFELSSAPQPTGAARTKVVGFNVPTGSRGKRSLIQAVVSAVQSHLSEAE